MKYPALALLFLAPALVAAQAPATRVVPIPKSLVADGIPAIPAAIPEEVRRYTEYRSAGFADWHPTRNEILVSTRFGNTAQVHLIAMPGGARRQLTFFDEPVGGASWEPRAGRYLIFSKDIGGNEFSQLYRFDPVRAEATLLSDGGRSQNGGATWSTTGDRIAYASTRRNGTDRDIYVMDTADPKTDRRIAEVEGGGWGVRDWSPDDRTLLVGESRSVNDSRLWLVDVATGTRTLLTPDTAVAVARGAGRFSADGRGIWLTTDEGGEFQRLAYMDLASRRVTPITTSIDWDVQGIALTRDRRTLAFTTNEAGVSRLYLMDTRTRQVRPVTSVPMGIIGGLDWRPDGRALGLTISTARSASDAYSLDPATGALTRWTESETGGLPADSLPLPELVTWKSFDGREISGFLYRPPASFRGPRPVIVNIHGGPEGQSRPGFIGRWNYFLVEQGAAIIFPNVRGSTGYGKTFVTLDNGMKRLESVRDIGALLDWIAAEPSLDESKVMVTGGSYGGYMTLAVATDYDARICCSLDVVGISNLATFLENTESYRRDLRRVEYGDERDPAMRAFMDSTAPLNNAQKITKPMFVVQGANDPRVPRSEAEQMVATLKRRDTPVWYLLGMDEGHGFQKKENVDYQFFATVAFVREHLLKAALTP